MKTTHAVTNVEVGGRLTVYSYLGSWTYRFADIVSGALTIRELAEDGGTEDITVDADGAVLRLFPGRQTALGKWYEAHALAA